MNVTQSEPFRYGKLGGTSGVFDLDSVYAMPVQFSFPFYHVAKPSLLPFISDKYLSLASPIATYWIVSAWYMFLDSMQFPFFEKYRLHEAEEITKRNRVSAKRVASMVVIQQAIQTLLGILILEDEQTSYAQVFCDHHARVRTLAQTVARLAVSALGPTYGVRLLTVLGPALANWLYWWGIPTVQLAWSFLVMDAWEYALHRAFHESRWLYNNFHSHHHRLYVPYAFGALYNHPIEGLLLDSAGAGLSHAASFMTIRQGILLFCFSTMKTVCDHGGYAFPAWLDPLHLVFPNTAEYHDVHHQMQGLRYNYSQPFFIHFDVLFGTRMSAEKFAKMRKVNEKYKQRNAVHKTTNAEASAMDAGKDKEKSTALAVTAFSEKAQAASGNGSVPQLRRRNERDTDADDRSAREIALEQHNPTVTMNGSDYRAKAGVAL